MHTLDEFKQKLDSPEWIESAREYMDNYFKKIEQTRKRVSSKEYISWIYDYISVNKQADDEGALYSYQGIDAENGQVLGAFLNYVKELAKEQRVLMGYDDDCEVDNEEVAVKIKDKYFRIFRMYGQGSWTSISLLSKKPDYAYVTVPYL